VPAGTFAADAQTSLTKKQKAKKKAKKKARKKAKRLKRLRRGPAGLKFYKPTRPIPNQHGKLIWARNAGGVVPLENAKSTKLVLYSSRSIKGKKVAVSGSVSIPKGKAPRRGWPVVTYGHGTTGIADKCAPTRNTAGGPAEAYISYTDNEMNEWLKRGYAVLRTDYEGLGTPGTHPFLIGKAAGRGVLDIVRAAHDLNPRIGKRFLIAGHSQGGHASLFAAGIADKWTPELKLRGTVAYAPASYLKDQASLLPALTTPSSLSALATMIVRGAASVSSAVDPSALLSDPVLDFYPDVDTDCLAQLAEPTSLGGIAPSTLIRSGADTTAFFDLLDQQNPVVASDAPILVAQGENDTTTFPFLTDRLATELDEIPGNKVIYSKYPGVDHGGIVDAASDEVEAWFAKRLPSGK
jgi:pimeloyl-ACP methyl ester carboxylesterase